MDFSGGVLLVAKILATNVVLTAALPRNRSAVHHEDVTGVWAASISVAGPICVYPSPQLIWFSRATAVSDGLIPSVTEIS